MDGQDLKFQIEDFRFMKIYKKERQIFNLKFLLLLIKLVAPRGIARLALLAEAETPVTWMRTMRPRLALLTETSRLYSLSRQSRLASLR